MFCGIVCVCFAQAAAKPQGKSNVPAAKVQPKSAPATRGAGQKGGR